MRLRGRPARHLHAGVEADVVEGEGNRLILVPIEEARVVDLEEDPASEAVIFRDLFVPDEEPRGLRTPGERLIEGQLHDEVVILDRYGAVVAEEFELPRIRLLGAYGVDLDGGGLHQGSLGGDLLNCNEL